ncbi:MULTISPECIES: HesB/YadR/YfhF family protein [Staphylococcus]|uniref:HesB/YadR/YfhF family protein n=1 Tax=Staphylococcus TaxID=1279 RepID=UPI0021CE712A|nr:hypothetical protein [Staphylococcus sp. IVB6181]UXV34007.1 hypothetical protein MUA90_08120 [Staphylococcus sp. IVB6181]
MEFNLTDKAIAWFKDEFDLPQEGKAIHFIVRYGGAPQIKQGFSPAFNIDSLANQPEEIAYENNFDGVNIIITENDLWYYQDITLTIDVDAQDEIVIKQNIEQE